MNQTASGPILTTEGIPLKVSLQKSERKNLLNHKWKKNSIDDTKAREDPELSINHSLKLI